jgi:hypothetical protein
MYKNNQVFGDFFSFLEKKLMENYLSMKDTFEEDGEHCVCLVSFISSLLCYVLLLK